MADYQYRVVQEMQWGLARIEKEIKDSEFYCWGYTLHRRKIMINIDRSSGIFTIKLDVTPYGDIASFKAEKEKQEWKIFDSGEKGIYFEFEVPCSGDNTEAILNYINICNELTYIDHTKSPEAEEAFYLSY